MIKKSFAGLCALVLLSAVSGSVAQAATTPAPSIATSCSKVGATTTIAGKSYTCVKVLSGKLIWSATSSSTSIGGAKPQISGAAGGEGEGPEGGLGEDHGVRSAAHSKHTHKLAPRGDD